jgi:hypothetical protein
MVVQARTCFIIEEISLRGANTVVDLNPARVKAQEEVHTTERILVSYMKNR